MASPFFDHSIRKCTACAARASARSLTSAPHAGLRTLRLGLSGIRSLALALPLLSVLDVNNAAELRCLELRCPLLLTVHMQACK